MARHTTVTGMNAADRPHHGFNWDRVLAVTALVLPLGLAGMGWAFGSVATRDYVDAAIAVHAAVETERFNRYAETTDKLEDLLVALRLEWAANKARPGGPADPPPPRADKRPPDDLPAPSPPESRPDPLEVQRQLDELIRQVREIKKE